jgi:hypothetical protein
MRSDIQELRERVENIAAINDESLAAKANYALDRLLDGWSEQELAL